MHRMVDNPCPAFVIDDIIRVDECAMSPVAQPPHIRQTSSLCNLSLAVEG
jgi:hypothetical protein